MKDYETFVGLQEDDIATVDCKQNGRLFDVIDSYGVMETWRRHGTFDGFDEDGISDERCNPLIIQVVWDIMIIIILTKGRTRD